MNLASGPNEGFAPISLQPSRLPVWKCSIRSRTPILPEKLHPRFATHFAYMILRRVLFPRLQPLSFPGDERPNRFWTRPKGCCLLLISLVKVSCPQWWRGINATRTCHLRFRLCSPVLKEDQVGEGRGEVKLNSGVCPFHNKTRKVVEYQNRVRVFQWGLRFSSALRHKKKSMCYISTLIRWSSRSDKYIQDMAKQSFSLAKGYTRYRIWCGILLKTVCNAT